MDDLLSVLRHPGSRLLAVVDVHTLRRSARRMEDTMTRLVHLTLSASLVLLLNMTPSWSQPVCASPGCDPTTSDANGNTAGRMSRMIRLSLENLRRAGYELFGRDPYVLSWCGHEHEFITVPATAGMWWLVPILGEAS